ncbi:hypothetical protein CBR_g3777 [Chara braunii]|uniref:Pre-mRNA-processing protein 40C n=2 Tax=Chara braunii TaxID=69332 RepID=A0A388KGD5_CHABU|nr:hypothetical protein CBR_g3777 [Chara braunii]|eukprot:GBG69078.1 hypothetical protein CBR_g3777 [Chara braunii]
MAQPQTGPPGGQPGHGPGPGPGPGPGINMNAGPVPVPGTMGPMSLASHPGALPPFSPSVQFSHPAQPPFNTAHLRPMGAPPPRFAPPPGPPPQGPPPSGMGPPLPGPPLPAGGPPRPPPLGVPPPGGPPCGPMPGRSPLAGSGPRHGIPSGPPHGPPGNPLGPGHIPPGNPLGPGNVHCPGSLTTFPPLVPLGPHMGPPPGSLPGPPPTAPPGPPPNAPPGIPLGVPGPPGVPAGLGAPLGPPHGIPPRFPLGPPPGPPPGIPGAPPGPPPAAGPPGPPPGVPLGPPSTVPLHGPPPLRPLGPPLGVPPGPPGAPPGPPCAPSGPPGGGRPADPNLANGGMPPGVHPPASAATPHATPQMLSPHSSAGASRDSPAASAATPSSDPSAPPIPSSPNFALHATSGGPPGVPTDSPSGTRGVQSTTPPGLPHAGQHRQFPGAPPSSTPGMPPGAPHGMNGPSDSQLRNQSGSVPSNLSLPSHRALPNAAPTDPSAASAGASPKTALHTSSGAPSCASPKSSPGAGGAPAQTPPGGPVPPPGTPGASPRPGPAPCAPASPRTDAVVKGHGAVPAGPPGAAPGVPTGMPHPTATTAITDAVPTSTIAGSTSCPTNPPSDASNTALAAAQTAGPTTVPRSGPSTDAAIAASQKSSGGPPSSVPSSPVKAREISSGDGHSGTTDAVTRAVGGVSESTPTGPGPTSSALPDGSAPGPGSSPADPARPPGQPQPQQSQESQPSLELQPSQQNQPPHQQEQQQQAQQTHPGASSTQAGLLGPGLRPISPAAPPGLPQFLSQLPAGLRPFIPGAGFIGPGMTQLAHLVPAGHMQGPLPHPQGAQITHFHGGGGFRLPPPPGSMGFNIVVQGATGQPPGSSPMVQVGPMSLPQLAQLRPPLQFLQPIHIAGMMRPGEQMTRPSAPLPSGPPPAALPGSMAPWGSPQMQILLPQMHMQQQLQAQAPQSQQQQHSDTQLQAQGQLQQVAQMQQSQAQTQGGQQMLQAGLTAPGTQLSPLAGSMSMTLHPPGAVPHQQHKQQLQPGGKAMGPVPGYHQMPGAQGAVPGLPSTSNLNPNHPPLAPVPVPSNVLIQRVKTSLAAAGIQQQPSLMGLPPGVTGTWTMVQGPVLGPIAVQPAKTGSQEGGPTTAGGTAGGKDAGPAADGPVGKRDDEGSEKKTVGGEMADAKVDAQGDSEMKDADTAGKEGGKDKEEKAKENKDKDKEVEAKKSNPDIEESWTAHKSADGTIYYYNSITGESTYERPKGFTGQPEKVAAQPTPVAWERLTGTDWALVTTNDGKKYYYNIKTQATSWQVPPEVTELKLKAELEKAKAAGDASHGGSGASKGMSLPAAVTGGREAIGAKALSAASSALDLVKKKLADSSATATPGVASVETSTVGPGTANGASAGGGTEAKTAEGDSKAAPSGEKGTKAESDGSSSESSSDSDEEEDNLSKEECANRFKEMLKEKGVAPFSKWDKELPKIIFDPRFKAIASHSERRSLFDHYVRTRADEERREKRAALKAAMDGFKQLLNEAEGEISHSTEYETFAEKWGEDPRFLALEKKDRETLLNERVLPLKKAEEERVKAEKDAAIAAFKELLNEKKEIVTSTARWSKTKDSLRDDPRYKALPRAEREAIFRAHVAALLAAEQEAERIAKAKKEEEEKQKARERELRKRKEREEEEMERARVKIRRKEAVVAFQALLVERVKDPEASWLEYKAKLEKDSSDGREDIMDIEVTEREQMFKEYLVVLNEKCEREYMQLLSEELSYDLAIRLDRDGKTIFNSWTEARKVLKTDLRYQRFPRKDRESFYRKYIEDLHRRLRRGATNDGGPGDMTAREEGEIGNGTGRSPLSRHHPSTRSSPRHGYHLRSPSPPHSHRHGHGNRR